jgi:hypothetical protein
MVGDDVLEDTAGFEEMVGIDVGLGAKLEVATIGLMGDKTCPSMMSP